MKTRIIAIDVMRGLTLFLMLFVNDLYEPGVPRWLLHAEANFDGMGLADWVFPGFLFMVGMSIPFAISSRKKKGESSFHILGHIVLRTLSLLLIGVLMLNIDRLNPELVGIKTEFWALLLYFSVFLVWNNYSKTEKYKTAFLGLRFLGGLMILGLMITFKAGTKGDVQWLETSWWGILGLIGWGYFVAAIFCLFSGNKIWAGILCWLLFLMLNMLSQKGMLGALDFIPSVFGVIIDGNVPSIVMAGVVVSLIVSKNYKPHKLLVMGSIIGVLALAFGFILRNWYIISKIYGTPSWAMICNGISILLFMGLYWLIDTQKIKSWSKIFEFVGQNSLTTYLAPDVIYFLCWGFGIPLFFYKQNVSELYAVSGSFIWASLMMVFSLFLSKINIKLKL